MYHSERNCKDHCSTRGMFIFIPGLLKLHVYGGISDERMVPYRPRVPLVP